MAEPTGLELIRATFPTPHTTLDREWQGPKVAVALKPFMRPYPTSPACHVLRLSWRLILSMPLQMAGHCQKSAPRSSHSTRLSRKFWGPRAQRESHSVRPPHGRARRRRWRWRQSTSPPRATTCLSCPSRATSGEQTGKIWRPVVGGARRRELGVCLSLECSQASGGVPGMPQPELW